MGMNRQPIALAITGASGSAYALRLLECLIAAGEAVYLMVSQAGQIVLKMESDLDLPSQPAEMERILSQRFGAAPGQLQVFGRQQWLAPVASGSNPPRAMVVCPCTTGTLSAIACGASNDLLERAADVALKERRKLILVVRETPFSDIHLENMLKLSRMGAVIMPANPGFYHHPKDLAGVVDFMVARILDQLDVPQDLMPRWGE
jgi:4-hydroxy-3-polyprenylbenzoate decarboxylase